jgi:hypothetical protein
LPVRQDAGERLSLWQDARRHLKGRQPYRTTKH